jgi:hypothetical protein
VLPCLVVFALNVALVWPALLPGEFPYRDSIEGGYAGMARFIRDHPNPWGWNPFVYAGLPTQHMYVPLLPYTTAFTSLLLPFLALEHVYRLLVVALTALGAVGLFWMVWFFLRSKRWAFATAMAYSLVSPAYWLYPAVDKDRGLAQLTWRMQTLLKYGEGPHNVGLTLIPFALLALWVAAQRRTPRLIFGAAVLLAAVVLTNWVAALALAWCSAMLLLTWVGAPRENARALLAAPAIAVLAWLLAAFWITPSLVETIATGWAPDSFQYKLRGAQSWLLAGLFAGAVALRALFLLVPRQTGLCFAALSAYGFGYVSLIYYRYGVDTIPESRRYAIEFEVFLFLAGALALHALTRLRLAPVRVAAWLAAALLLAAGAGQVRKNVLKNYSRLRPLAPQSTTEKQVADWLAEHRPRGRVFVSGGTRFRLQQWHELHQLGGTFETGLRSRRAWNFNWHIRTGADSLPGEHFADALRELNAAGIEYLAIHRKGSGEHYEDFRHPEVFEGKLETAWDSGLDVIYRVPFRSLAHLIGPEEKPRSFTFRYIPEYARAIADLERPGLSFVWRSPSRLEISGPVPPGMLVSVQVNDDPGWVATQDGAPVARSTDKLGFVLLEARPAAHTALVLDYRAIPQVKFCALLSLLAWLGAAVWAWRAGPGPSP